jgi:acyl-CoA synthetase (AMP-forming)/AMP-acid ligase II/acyl carrier protein
VNLLAELDRDLSSLGLDESRSALIDDSGSAITSSELLESLHDTARWIASADELSRPVVGVFLPPGMLEFIGIVASSSSGVAVPMDWRSGAADIASTLSRAGASSVLTTVGGATRLRRMLAGREDLELREALGSSEDALALVSVGRNARRHHEVLVHRNVCLLVRTSGTTGTWKLVALTPQVVMSSARRMSRSLDLAAGDVCFNPMPLHHTHGLVGGLLGPLVSGSRVLLVRSRDISDYASLIKRHQCTWITASPAVYSMLVNYVTEPPSAGLRFARNASSRLSPVLAERVEKVLGVPIIDAYALTEAPGVVCSNPASWARRPGVVGLPQGAVVAALNHETKPLAPGVVGSVGIRKDPLVVAEGYYDSSTGMSPLEGDAEWFVTGDDGLIDERGELKLVGRRGTTINRGGEMLSPAEIEDVVCAHPDVQEAAVVGIPDEVLGENIGLVIGTPDVRKVSQRDIRAFLSDLLAPSKLPSVVVVMNSLPANSVGKVNIGTVRQLIIDAQRSGEMGEETEIGNENLDLRAAIWGLWISVLGAVEVDQRETDFISIGDSIRAIQLVAKIRSAFDTSIPIDDVLRPGMTVARMASIVDEKRAREEAADSRKVSEEGA